MALRLANFQGRKRLGLTRICGRGCYTLRRAIVTGALRGISHPNTDLDAQTFLLRVRQLRLESGVNPDLPVTYRPQVTVAELEDPRVLIWDIGRNYQADRGNFDHHQDHNLGATPIILLQALGLQPSPLDEYVDKGDRGLFFKHPQPHRFVETLHGMASGINLVHAQDEIRSGHYQALLTWVEESGTDPYSRMTEGLLPERFHVFQRARREEEVAARAVAEGARWFQTRIGQVASVSAGYVGVMQVLYERGAALVILHEPHGHMSGWSRSAPKFTVGANPAVVAVPKELDLRPLFATLSALEPSGHSWGGQAGIGGSPREDGGSGLTAEQVIREVRNYLS
jgi:hypothetical protein